ncbi:MAG TPA: hypothetical protein VIV60_33395, partial [Polyangiaceae bacterium]
MVAKLRCGARGTVIARLIRLALSVAVLGGCSTHAVCPAPASQQAQLVVQKASLREGLVGTLRSKTGAISFEVRRVDPSDPVARRDPDYGKSAQTRIRDSRGVSIWGVDSNEGEPDIVSEARRREQLTSPTSQADIDLVIQLPDTL